MICGGSDKNLPMDTLAAELEKRAKYVVLTGTTGVRLAELFDTVGYKKYIYERDFEKAVRAAAGFAEEGDIVLLSPAAASFDSFRNFEKRGDFFCDIVRNL